MDDLTPEQIALILKILGNRRAPLYKKVEKLENLEPFCHMDTIDLLITVVDYEKGKGKKRSVQTRRKAFIKLGPNRYEDQQEWELALIRFLEATE